MESNRPVIVIHGGAWSIPNSLAAASIEGVKHAASTGYKVLQSGGSALDAVQAAILTLEDDPAFDAGTGSVLNAIGEIEMDSIVMDGQSLTYGAVAGVSNIRNPVKLARHILTEHQNVLLVGDMANRFAQKMGVETATMEQLVTAEAKEEWLNLVKYKKVIATNFKSGQREYSDGVGHDTVGAVALDCNGNVAFGTSTGGITAKRPGRVGDSPLIGSGGIADNHVGAVSTTGHGEAITKVCLAKDISLGMRKGLSAQESVEQSLSYMLDRVNGCGGAIVISNTGQIGISFTTERMAWAWKKGDQLKYGLNPGDNGIGSPVTSVKTCLPPNIDIATPINRPIVMIHCISNEATAQQKISCQVAAQVAHTFLMEGGIAVYAAVKAIRQIEEEYCTKDGHKSEMDAMIMEGKHMKTGAVSCVSNLVHPVDLAELVMDETEHTLLIDKGASRFAEEKGLLTVKQSNTDKSTCHQGYHGIGVVVLDLHGNTACSISSQRHEADGIADSAAIVGCGGYADNSIGCVSILGDSGSICKHVLAKEVMHLIKEGGSNNVDQSMDSLLKRSGKDMGLVLINKDTHTCTVHANMETRTMTFAAIDTNGEMVCDLKSKSV